MNLRNKFILLFYIVSSIVPYVWSIKCWNCQSKYDPKCADPFDNSTIPITDCTHEIGLPVPHLSGLRHGMCRKIRQKVNGEWIYIRDCAYQEKGDEGIQSDERSCFMKTGTENMLVEYCTCDSKDGCNSSSIINPLPLLVTLAGLISWFKIVS